MKQLVLDTNIFLRLLIADIPNQFQESKTVFTAIEEGKVRGLVSILVINELIWVLENFYKQDRKIYLLHLLRLLTLRRIRIFDTQKSLVLKVLERMQTQKFDFTDIYLATQFSRSEIFSFDKDFDRIYQ